MQLADFLQSQGWDVRSSFGTETAGVKVFVRDVYNALNNGTDAVVVFDSYTSEENIAATAEAAENADESILVLRNTDTFVKGKRKGQHYDAKTLMSRIDARNAVSVTDENVETLGRVAFTSPVFDGADLRGFVVTRS